MDHDRAFKFVFMIKIQFQNPWNRFAQFRVKFINGEFWDPIWFVKYLSQ